MSRPIRRCPVSLAVLEEIALEGLEGITLSTLWSYLSVDLEVELPLPSDVKERVWNFIKRNTHQLDFYELPVERPIMFCENRFSYVEPDFGIPLVPDPSKFPRYKFVPVEDGDIRGSCEYYKERKKIDVKEVNDLNVDAVLERWGNRFVIVASQELRYCVLTPKNKPIPLDLTLLQYCVWEAIGRSRYNGETTTGQCSIYPMCKDSSVVFYIKQRLIYIGLIVQSPLNEFRDDRLVVSSLLNLPQYVPEIPSNIICLIEKIYGLVKKSGHLALTELRRTIPIFSRKSTFRNLVVTPYFQRVFEVKKVFTGQQSAKKRDVSVLAITLKNPETPLDDLIDEVREIDKEVGIDFTDAFVDDKHSFVDMPIREEFYRAVLRHGTRGCSHTDLGNYLSESHSVVRQMVKAMLRTGLIVSHTVDEGRQRIHRYVALEVINAQKANKPKEDEKPAEVPKFIDLPPMSHVEDICNVDYAQIESTLEDYVYKEKQFRVVFTSRQQYRRNFIVRQLNETYLMSCIILRNRLQEAELKLGHKDEMCFKSLVRIFMEMKRSENLKIYEITLKYKGHTRLYRYVAHPQIDKNHILLRKEISSLKNTLVMSRERQESKRHNQELLLAKRALNASRKTQKLTENKNLKLNITPDQLPTPPKFLLSRYMHEFLFYIVVELNENQHLLEIDESLLQKWKENEPSLQVNEFLQTLHAGIEVQHAYMQQLNWRTFIPPLPKYSDKPAGWVNMVDAIDRMPLLIFNKMFRFQQTKDNALEEYLAHPIRQNYLIRQLPIDLQNQINRLYLHRICTMVLKLLNHMGLIQVGESINFKDTMNIWIYLNRRTQILDTTPSEASYNKINTARKYEKLDFHFSTFEDIVMYWNNVHRICVYTKLGRLSAKSEKTQKRKELSFLPTVSFDEAPNFDNGQVPGDRAGAAGFASRLFAHALRAWSWILSTNVKPLLTRTGRLPLSRLTSSKHLRLMGLRKSRLHGAHVKRLPHSTTAKRGTLKKSSSMRDAIDRDALKNMRTLRAIWDKNEDDLLKLARAVFVYVAAPVPVLGLMVVGKICRDVIRYSLGIRNKTTQACHRRMQYIVKMGRHIPEVPTWVHLLRTNAEIQQRYGGNFLQELKVVYPEREEYCQALALHFIQIFHFLYELVQNNKDNEITTAARPRFQIPDSIDEFQRLYAQRAAAQEAKGMKYIEPNNEQDALIVLAINVLHSSLCSALDKTTYTAQAFEIFKKFSEETLQRAFKLARNGTLIVANKRKNIEMLPSQLTSPAYSLSVHYQRRLIFLRIPYHIYDSHFGFFENTIEVLMQPKEEEFLDVPSTSRAHALKNIVELRSPNAGQLFFIGEGLARNFWNCKIKFPSNILTVDAEKRQTLSSMDRILDHYHCIFDHAPETEYTKNFENEANGRQIRVKFQPANLSYKITYSPYDLISKLPTRHLHFFCALDHLNQEVEINFSRLMRKDDEHDTFCIECPFNCVLKHANYINAIERIVQEKRNVLRDLTEMPPQKLLNLALSGCSVTVESSSLLTLVRMLESFWREKETAYEKKDLGRVSEKVKVNKSIDWHQLCCEILQYNAAEEDTDKNDDYEPTLNKEERLARAQDVFVVNLPTLQLEANKDFCLFSKETVLHNDVCVPKRLMEPELLREQILRKIVDESHWKYTENTFEVLKPKLSKLGFNEMEQHHVEDLLKFIEKHKLGVPVTELLREFPYTQFLSRALRLLSEHYLVKRVGVTKPMYVHKTNIRPWVVHTFHLKRLEREKLGPDGTASLKRAATADEVTLNEECGEETCPSKRAKLTDDASEAAENQRSSKRTPKPVKRFESESTDFKKERESKSDVIVMKPHPWIRLNGTINRRVLDRWMGSLLTECISRCGIMVLELCSKFPHLAPVDVMFLLEILSDLKCIHLTEMKPDAPSLFSSYENLEETIVTEFYVPEHTYVTAHADALTRMSLFIGKKKYSTQFF